MQYIFVVNPCAGQNDTVKMIRQTISVLPQKNDCSIYITKSIGDARQFVKLTCETEKEQNLRFIACGGDGTINEVFSGVMGYPNVSVSCYPSGSGNDFVKVFGTEKFKDVEKLLTAPVQKIDVIKVGTHYSFNVVDFGFDTAVAIQINEKRKKTGHGNKNAYKKGIFKAFIKNMNNKCTVTADGQVLNPDGHLLLATVANGKYVGGSFHCAPRAKIDDGLLEVCLIKPISRLRFFKILVPYTNGKHLDREDMRDVIIYRQAKKIEVSAPEGFAYSLDGEIIYDNHFTIEIIPSALQFACPR